LDGAAQAPVIVWQPQRGPQTAFLACPVFEIFFGGARGGGKTDAVLGEWAVHADRYGKSAIGLMVRRSRVELTETFERAKTIFTPLGASFTTMPMRVVMPGGARLTFAYLERDADAEAYQGHSYTRVYVEEAGNFPTAAPILKLFATLRSGDGVPCQIRLTGNPGGPGHQWVKARYIDPDPLGWRVITDAESGLERVYIPSRVGDNTHLGPDYVQRIKASGSATLVKAWLDGDWSIIAGAFFPEFSTLSHVVPAQELPPSWARFRAMDWGSAKPFSVGWYAISDGSMSRFPRGALIRYREWYGSTGEPNTGLRMTAEQVADGILAREKADGPRMLGVADPAIFSEDGGPSIGERMHRRGVIFRRADNARVAQRGAMGGWDQVRARLIGDGEKPALYLFDTCRDLIRTLPGLQHDKARAEDVDTEGEDHAADELRYACMSRPYIAPLKRDDRAPRDRYGRNERVAEDWKTA